MAQADTHSTTPKLPRVLPKAAVNKVSAAIEAHLDAVQALHEFLDTAEGDADEEDSDPGEDSDEDCCNVGEDFGSSPTPCLAAVPNSDPYGDEREASLGWTAWLNQSFVAQECEDNGYVDVEGPDTDREPSLGSIGAGSAAHSQTSWAAGGVDDREQDVGDEGELENDL